MRKIILFVALSLVVFAGIKLDVISDYTQEVSLASTSTVVPAPLDNSKINNVGRGVYDLFAPQFRCSNFLNSLNNVKNLNIATLFNTFGNDFDCARSVLQDPRLRNFEVHLINEPCARNHRCGRYEFLAGISPQKFSNLLKGKNPDLKKKFDKYVAPLQDLLAGYLQPGTECQISFGLESNVTDIRAVKTAIAWTREAFPQCKLVWNPLQIPDDSVIKKVGVDYIEGHGDSPPISAPCIADNDGTEIPLSKMQDFVDSYAHCKMTALWTAADNGYGPGQTTFVDPRTRSFNPGTANRDLAKEIVKAERKTNPYQNPPSSVWTDAENKSLIGCKTILPSRDGNKRGFLLKQSDAHTGIVVLLPGTPQKKGQPNEGRAKGAVFLYKGKKLFSLPRTGTFGEDQFGNRPLLRTDDRYKIKLVDIPFHSVLSVDNGRTCRKFDNPKVRND